MSTFDPYLTSQINPANAKTFLYDYALNRLGLGPKAPSMGVPNVNTPYKGTSGNFVGTDTSKVGGNNRNIDLERPDLHSNYVGVDPDKQNVVEYKGNVYAIDKDQQLAGDRVIDKDAPKGFWKGVASTIDALTFDATDLDQRGRIWSGYKGRPTDVETLPTTRRKSQAELEMDSDLAKEGHYDRKNDKALDRAMKTAEHQAAVDLNYMKQLYPIAQAAAWDATKRGIYGDKYSASAAQRRMVESAGAEAQMMTGIANQANAAANLRGRYTGKNLSFG